VKSKPFLNSLCFFVLGACVSASGQTAAPPAAKPGGMSCAVQQRVPETPAGRAFNERNYSKAEALYRALATIATKDSDYADATQGLVQSLLEEDKTLDALNVATNALKLHPDNAVLLDAEGEALFRRGETNRAAIAWNDAAKADYCNGRVHFDMARFFHLNAEYLSEQRQLDLAHQLAPHNNAINRARNATTSTESNEDRIARLQERLEGNQLSPDSKAALQRTIDVLRAESKGSCEIVHAVPSAQIPIVPIGTSDVEIRGAGLDLLLNGKKRRMLLDTGASGLLLSRAAARAAGLITEAEALGGGIGDQGPQKEFLAHVDNIKVGEMEFHNCLVRITNKGDVTGVDGLVGPDIFSSYVVTLDIPSRVVRLDPLPARPDETASTTASLDTSGADVEAEAAPRNRYVAPEMATWTKIFRSGHLLIFPTNINGGSTRLFVMDTGASGDGLVSIEAAKEVTSVGASDYIMTGVSGTVNDVKSADNITIVFGGMREKLRDVPAIDLSQFTRGAGTEISGFIGFSTLAELIISIDYRDSLVHVAYDPKHGFHRH